jgi:ERCC4-type nuclease
MIIKIDCRERDLLTQIKNLILFIPAYKELSFVVESLPIGDIIIEDKDKKEILIIERKNLNDLLASIKDGRYEEQSYRLNGLNHHNHNIYYIIEGDVNRMNNRFKDNGMEKMTLYSAMFSLNYYKGFSVMRTFTIEETALFICNTANKLKKTEKLPFYNNIMVPTNNATTNNATTNNATTNNTTTTNNVIIKENGVEEDVENENNNNVILETIENSPDHDYVSVVKKVKKENITQDNIGEIMLSQIPGVSAVTAIAIMNKFKTLPILFKEVSENADCLQNITYTNAKGQNRKITKTSVANILTFLFRKV